MPGNRPERRPPRRVGERRHQLLKLFCLLVRQGRIRFHCLGDVLGKGLDGGTGFIVTDIMPDGPG
jgi:hypothetical protein